MMFLALLAIPLLVALGFLIFGSKNVELGYRQRFTRRVTLAEFAIQVAVQAAIAGISIAVIYHMDVADTEAWNGRVADKAKVKVHCSHSYQCNCVTVCSGSGKSRSCTRICQTCYEHTHDFDWRVTTTNRETLEIDRVNRQGTEEPPRWTAVKIGEPTSLPHGYENYIKAAPDTLFRHQGLTERFKDLLPAYPDKFYDYYRLNRLVLPTLMAVDPREWNNALSELNADLGASKQVNVVVVLLNHMPSEYFEALEQHWIGGKKNDVIVVLSSDGNKIEWARVMAWTDSAIFKVKLRDDLIGMPVNPVMVTEIIKSRVNAHYIRKPMKDFEYLTASITPTPTQWMVSMLLGLLTSIGLGVFFYKNETV